MTLTSTGTEREYIQPDWARERARDLAADPLKRDFLRALDKRHRDADEKPSLCASQPGASSDFAGLPSFDIPPNKSDAVGRRRDTVSRGASCVVPANDLSQRASTEGAHEIRQQSRPAIGVQGGGGRELAAAPNFQTVSGESNPILSSRAYAPCAAVQGSPDVQCARCGNRGVVIMLADQFFCRRCAAPETVDPRVDEFEPELERARR